MSTSITKLKKHLPEIIFQIGLLIIVFAFYAYKKHRHHTEEIDIEISKVYFFLNYVVAAMIINYFLLPKFLYKRKFILFILYVVILITAVIIVEESVLEQIFYPDTRGRKFSSALNNLISTLPIITILVGFKFAWNAIRHQRELEVLESAVKESELEFLKTQINPHFLFNNLNNLYSYALEQSPKTPEIILELSGVLRYMLYECKEATVPLKKEIEQLDNFINLNKLQIEERGEVTLKTKGIQPEYTIAPLILSVFIENAFKHSASSKKDNIIINVELNLNSDGKLYFLCENNYSDISNTDNLPEGIGLKNVQKRLNLLYQDKHQLKIEETNNQFIVELVLQLEKS